MIWVFKGDFGIIQKAVKVKLKVVTLQEKEKIAFNLEGLSDNINGDGFFTMESVAADSLKLTGCMKLEGGGFLASMINPVLEKFVPEMVIELVTEIGECAMQTIQ